ncbi:MAG: hypothetical protein DMF91_18770, partial [Acidobacteria bacterium]
MTNEPTLLKPIRVWPGVVAAILMVGMRFVLPLAAPGGTVIGLIGAALSALAIVVWWLFFSRAPWSERLGALVLMIVALVVTKRLVHESIAGGGMGNLLYFLAIPVQTLALVVWAVASRHLSSGPRRASMVATILLATGFFTIVRTAGITSNVMGSEFHWRWTPSPEERLLAQASDEPLDVARRAVPTPAPAAAEVPKEPPAAKGGDEKAALPTGPAAAKKEPAAPTAVETAAEWPGFRGPGRDSIIRGVQIETDWSKSPPVALWRRPIGPGWSSFAVHGDLLYTQEQRGGDEIVACYKVSTGGPV